MFKFYSILGVQNEEVVYVIVFIELGSFMKMCV